MMPKKRHAGERQGRPGDDILWSLSSRIGTSKSETKSSVSPEPGKSIRPEPGEPHDFAPLVGFGSDELAEIGRRAGEHGCSLIGELHLELRVGEAGIDRAVEDRNDLGGRALRCREAIPRG